MSTISRISEGELAHSREVARSIHKQRLKSIRKEIPIYLNKNMSVMSKQRTETNAFVTPKRQGNESLVINFSDRTLSTEEREVLELGLDFEFRPSLDKDDLIAELEVCLLSVSDGVQKEVIRHELANVMKKVPSKGSQNLSPSELRTIKQLRTLVDDRVIRILPADKGKATVILNENDYIKKVNDILSSDAYEIMKKDPWLSVRKQLSSIFQILKDQAMVTQDEYRFLLPTTYSMPYFFGLPKVHKANVPLRPVVATTGCLTYNLARFWTNVLKPFQERIESRILNSNELCKKIKDWKIAEEEILVSLDVVSMYPSIPIEESLDIIRNRLECDSTLKDRCKWPVATIMNVLRIVLTSSFFTFEDKIYRQKEGVSMGSPVSPIVADILWMNLNVKRLK